MSVSTLNALKTKYHIEYGLLRGAISFINILPLPLITAVTYCIGWLIWIIFPFRLPVAYNNLSTVWPNSGHAEKLRLLKKVYLQFPQTFGLIFILHRKKIFRMIQNAEITGRSKLEKALAQGKGIILTTYHGFWFEAYFAWFNSNDLPTSLIYQRQNNPLSDAYFIRQRHRYGTSLEHLHTHVGMQSFQEALQRNRILIISLDQSSFHKGTVIPFFNRPLHCAKGTSILHLRSQAPVMSSIYYFKNGKFHIDFDDISLPEYDAINEKNIRDICTRSIKGYESFIRENPEQWFSLFHRLWTKTDYPKSVKRSLKQIFF